MKLIQEILDFSQYYLSLFEEYSLPFLKIDISKDFFEFQQKTRNYYEDFLKASSNQSKKVLLKDLQYIKKELDKTNFFDANTIILTDFEEPFQKFNDGQNIEELVKKLIKNRGYNKVESSILFNFIKSYHFKKDKQDSIEKFLPDLNAVVYSNSGLNYLYTQIDNALFVCAESQNLLFDMIKGLNNYLFALNSQIYDKKLGYGYLYNKEEFFVWSLVHLSKHLSDLNLNDIKEQAIQLSDFVNKQKTDNKVLAKYQFLLPAVNELYEQYGISSIIKYGLNIKESQVEALVHHVLNDILDNKRYNDKNLSVRVIPSTHFDSAKVLIVDYTNSIDEKIVFNELSFAYLLPEIKFKQYVENVDLFLNLFYTRGKSFNRFSDPFKDLKLDFDENKLSEIAKYNKDSLYRIRTISFEDEKLKNYEKQIKEKNLEPYTSFFDYLEIIETLIQETNNYRALNDFLSNQRGAKENINANKNQKL
ncbi:MAG: hypothetical protein PWR32_340 [Candidatus Woesearchaeota archaeon]|nr:hypothetical protein [Candidatus Woesearchaeota archaeon]